MTDPGQGVGSSLNKCSDANGGRAGESGVKSGGLLMSAMAQCRESESGTKPSLSRSLGLLLLESIGSPRF